MKTRKSKRRSNPRSKKARSIRAGAKKREVSSNSKKSHTKAIAGAALAIGGLGSLGFYVHQRGSTDTPALQTVPVPQVPVSQVSSSQVPVSSSQVPVPEDDVGVNLASQGFLDQSIMVFNSDYATVTCGRLILLMNDLRQNPDTISSLKSNMQQLIADLTQSELDNCLVKINKAFTQELDPQVTPQQKEFIGKLTEQLKLEYPMIIRAKTKIEEPALRNITLPCATLLILIDDDQVPANAQSASPVIKNMALSLKTDQINGCFRKIILQIDQSKHSKLEQLKNVLFQIQVNELNSLLAKYITELAGISQTNKKTSKELKELNTKITTHMALMDINTINACYESVFKTSLSDYDSQFKTRVETDLNNIRSRNKERRKAQPVMHSDNNIQSY